MGLWLPKSEQIGELLVFGNSSRQFGPCSPGLYNQRDWCHLQEGQNPQKNSVWTRLVSLRRFSKYYFSRRLKIYSLQDLARLSCTPMHSSYKIFQDLHLLQVSCRIGIFLAILQYSYKFRKMFCRPHLARYSYPIISFLTYAGRIAKNSCFLQVLERKKFSVIGCNLRTFSHFDWHLRSLFQTNWPRWNQGGPQTSVSSSWRPNGCTLQPRSLRKT